LLLGWRPDEFWNATPAELGCVLGAFAAQSDAPPDLEKLMALFPDAPTEVNNG
jgi:hypothetical protein